MTLSSLAIALLLLIVFDSYYSGLDLTTYNKLINYETAHLKFFPLGYKEDIDNLPIEKAFDPAPVLSVLLADPLVKSAAPGSVSVQPCPTGPISSRRWDWRSIPHRTKPFSL